MMRKINRGRNGPLAPAGKGLIILHMFQNGENRNIHCSEGTTYSEGERWGTTQVFPDLTLIGTYHHALNYLGLQSPALHMLGV